MTVVKAARGVPFGRAGIAACGMAVPLLAVLPLLAAWWLFGELLAYPFNDDFLYARSAQILVDEGRFEKTALNGLPTVSAATQIVWGAAWCWLTGFSYRTLVVSTLLLACLGALAAYALARASGCGRACSWLLATTLVCSPYYFGHACTFMTDGPAVALALLALVGYVRGWRGRSDRWMLLGALVCLAGVWLRETCAAALLAPLLALVLDGRRQTQRGGRPLSRSLRAAAAALVLPAGGLLFLLAGGFETGNVHGHFPGLARSLNAAWYWRAAIDAYGSALFVGFAALPLAPVLAYRACVAWRTFRWRAAAGASLGVLLGTAFLATGARTYITNATGPYLQNAHFGPILLSDAYDAGRLGDMGDVVWPTWIWQLVTVLAIGNAGLLGAVAAATFARWKIEEAEGSIASMNLALVCTLLASAVCLLAMFEVRFDRYWMTLLPPLFAWLAGELGSSGALPSAATSACRKNLEHAVAAACCSGRAPTFVLASAAVCLLPMMGVSFAFTHDVLAFNRACWKVVEDWRWEEFRPEQIDGGYAINGWFRSAEDPATMPRTGDATRWWSSRAERFLAVAPRPGFDVVVRESWRSWATGRDHYVFGLCRSRHSSRRGLAEGGSARGI